VYLQADTDVLMQRIASRDRSYERQMERGYIDELNRAYDDFFLKPARKVPVLVIETNNLNYVARKDDLNWTADRIREALANPPLQPGLPMDTKLNNLFKNLICLSLRNWWRSSRNQLLQS